jgi:thymidylate kinase
MFLKFLVMAKGKFITLYGINNIGKSTQAQILTERLIGAGYDAEFLKYPNYSVEPTGKFLDSVLRGASEQKISEDELQMWFVLNRYQFQPEIEKKLEEGKILVAEDYIGTGIAWGIAKGLDRKWLEAINEKLLKEDLAIMLYGNRHVSAKEPSHIHEQNDALIEKCRLVHEDLAARYGWKKVEVKEQITDTAGGLWEVVEGFLK